MNNENSLVLVFVRDISPLPYKIYRIKNVPEPINIGIFRRSVVVRGSRVKRRRFRFNFGWTTLAEWEYVLLKD